MPSIIKIGISKKILTIEHEIKTNLSEDVSIFFIN